MRIITGSARGMVIESLPGEDTRPTLERVKEGVFSAIQFDIPGARVLDLFAGTGQMGLEALSRGASAATFVDSSGDAVSIIKKNAQKTKLMEKCTVVQYKWDEYVRGAARRGEKDFDLIYLDPPFGMGLQEEAVKAILKAGLLGENGKIICEDENPAVIEAEGLSLYRQYKYGRTYITIYEKAASAI